jgi:acyl carrier protein
VSRQELQRLVERVLGRIAPEADLAALDPKLELREQLDIDSMDFLNFAIGLHQELGIDIPEADMARLATLAGCVDYLGSRLGADGRSRGG